MKRLCLILTLLWASPALAQVTYDTHSAQTYSSSSSPTVSGMTVASNSDRILLAFPTGGSDHEATTDSTWNTSETMTEAETAFNTGFAMVEAWYVSDGTHPTATTADCVTDYNTPITGQLTCVSLYNVDTSSPIRDMATENGNGGTDAGLTLTTQSGDMVISCFFARNDSITDPGTLTPSAGTELTQNNISTVYRSSCTRITASGSSTSISWSWSGGGGADDWAHVAVAIAQKPAASGPPTGTLNLLGVGK